MILGIIKLVGVFLFLYLIWRNLYEDYREDLLIAYGWSSLLLFLISGRMFYGLGSGNFVNVDILNWLAIWKLGEFNYVAATLILCLWTWRVCLVNSWKIWSFLEDLIPIYSLLVSFLWISQVGEGILVMKNYLVLIVLMGGFLLSNYFKDKYRSYVWYKSGKKGFIFFVVSMFICLGFGSISLLIHNDMLSGLVFVFMGLIFGIGLVMLGEIYVAKK